MEVILLQKVANLGNIGDRVKVKSGFGRNFLLPQGKATLATAGQYRALRSAPRGARKARARAALVRGGARRALKEFKLVIAAKAGTEGKLFGSIGTSDIAEAATARRHPVASAAKCVCRTAPLRTVGEHTVHAASACRCRCAAGRVDRRRRVSRRRLCSPVAGPAKARRDSGPLALADAPVPPHSVEAEQAVLGGLLLDPDRLGQRRRRRARRRISTAPITS